MEQPFLIDVPITAPPSTEQLIESLLFIAGEPVTVAQLARSLELPADAIEAAIERLGVACAGRGIRVQRHSDQIQLVSAPEAASAVERFLGVQSQQRLSAAALEVLAIIAYRQPITRAQIEAVRGVDCGGVVRALLGRELIAEIGRLETVGRPILYGTTTEFLRQFGLSSLSELPPLPELQEPTEM
ncbi:MAG: SMC-Scp complex subunit ScpB [Roseiflexaceae bacterium]|nr:SMC-Scp complex subunit ScpB [Roseiflexaceae bacterium]